MTDTPASSESMLRDEKIGWLIDLLCLTLLSAIFQLYHGNQF